MARPPAKLARRLNLRLPPDSQQSPADSSRLAEIGPWGGLHPLSRQVRNASVPDLTTRDFQSPWAALALLLPGGARPPASCTRSERW